ERGRVIRTVLHPLAAAATRQVGHDDAHALARKPPRDEVEVACVPSEAVDANHDLPGIRRPPFGQADAQEAPRPERGELLQARGYEFFFSHSKMFFPRMPWL